MSEETSLLQSLHDADLASLGIAEPARARRILLSLAGQGVTDDDVERLLPSIFQALRQSPDPDRALNNFARWMESLTGRYTHVQYLLRHPVALDIFFNVCGVSQFFSDILIRNPEYFEILSNPGVRGGSKAGADLYKELSAFVDAIVRTELKLEAMRRFKQREVLRIGTRDILGLADMPTTAREFSNLADACIQKCYDIAVAQMAERYPTSVSGARGCPVPFAVIAMGKLGGQELNYSSDIDLMFVCGEEYLLSNGEQAPPRLTPVEYALRLAEAIVSALSKTLQNGHLFRVDMRLRPEGRFGALVRTLSSYRAYYESWAEPWERQALLKARPVAGDAQLGEAFMEMIRPFVYRRSVTSEFVAAIRRNKERIEKKAEMEGQTYTNVKVGYGAIRDIEFAVQLLQLQYGGRNALLRTPNTLEAIGRLRQAGILTETEARELGEDYIFLRNVEHRLQILYDRQTQSLPADPAERRLLARRLGFPDLESFQTEYERRTQRVRRHFEALFYDSRPHTRPETASVWSDLLLNVETPAARAAIIERLEAAGFHDPVRGYAHLKQAAFGGEYGLLPPETRQTFLELAARLVAEAAHTGDPDAVLNGMEILAQAMPNRMQFYLTLSQSEELLERLCRLAAGSPPLIQSLARHLEWLDLLVSEEILDPSAKPPEVYRAQLEERLGGIRQPDAFWRSLALYIQRERLRIGARDIWGEIPAMAVCQELTALAEAVIGVVLSFTIDRLVERYSHSSLVRDTLDTVAVIGLGKLGGRELGYGSDLDILIVFEPPPTAPIEVDSPPESRDTLPSSVAVTPHQVVNALAEELLAAGEKLRDQGAPITIDARLRPEGRFGALARTVEEYRDYYAHTALTWERQTLTKARPVAGNAQTARHYMRAVHTILYGSPLSEEAAEEIRAMKRRMEQERLKPEERRSDIKLGHGGLSDIEFLAQILQLRFGAAYPQVRVPGTCEALHALSAAGALHSPEAARLAETYALWTAIRNRLALLGGLSVHTLPSDAPRLRALAVGLGTTDAGGKTAEELFLARFEARMAETRAIVERRFYH